MDPKPGGSKDLNMEENISLKRRTLWEKMLDCQSTKFEDRCQHILAYIMDITHCPEDMSHVIKHKLSYFYSDFKAKYKSAQCKKDRFFAQNTKWLDADVVFPLFNTKTRTVSGGRPPLDFSKSSERSKRRKTEKVRSELTTAELVYAAQMNLRAEGNIEAATVVKEVNFSTPTRARKYRTAYKEREDKTQELSGERALSVLVEAKLTRHQYDHTVKRIVKVQTDVLESLTENERQCLTLVCKWGCDGSSGFTEYKQKFESGEHSDASIFLTSLVPIQLTCTKTKKIVWHNPRPGSPRFCRPIRLQFIHETTEVTLSEKNYIENQIKNLTATAVTFGTMSVNISYSMLFTMIDGKVCNAASSTTSTQRCYICGETSKNFNKIDIMLRKDINTSSLSFGLSSLHAWIRFLEYLLHMAYKLPIKQWQARGNENQKIVAERKKKIQEDFKSKMGLIVDRPKPGFGSSNTSNDGNTARRFFENVSLSSEITGIDEDIIRRLKVVLQTISSGFHVNLESFKDYTLSTARLLVEKYPWYNMPTTVHKILIHSSDIIKTFLIPIGQLSEEAQEALNKDVKKYREGFARKSSRKQTLEDVFNRLLLSSDPVISTIRKLPRRHSKSFEEDVLRLLLPPEVLSPMDPDSSSEDSLEESEDE